MQSGRIVGATPAGDHAAARKVGGARIGFSAGEDFDDDHRRTTMRTDERGLEVGGVGRRWRFSRGGDDVQQFARPGEMLAAPGIGEQPVVADAMKAAG